MSTYRYLIGLDIPAVVDMDCRAHEKYGLNDHALRQLSGSPHILSLVDERKEQIVGYMIYERRSTGIFLYRLVVDFDHRRQGIGRGLMRKLLDNMKGTKHKMVWTDVLHDMLPGQLFLKAMGFKGSISPQDPDVYRFVLKLI